MAANPALSVTHRGLDGTVFTLSGKLDLSQPYSSITRLYFARRLHELTAMGSEFAQDWATSFGVPQLSEEFGMHQGRLRVGHGTSLDKSLQDFPELRNKKVAERVMAAIWEGRRHALCAHFYGARTNDAIRLFDALRITEHAEGIEIAANQRKQVTFAETASVAKAVPDLGLLEMTALNRETARRLPKWRGTQLPTGELFRDTHGDGSTYFVFATNSAVVTVLPDDEEVRRTPARLGGLTIQAA